MKWISHIAIAGSTTAIFEPKLVPLAVFGGVFPDLAEGIANNLFRMNLKHRQETHYFAYWLISFIACFALELDWITAFCWGGLTHILADACTITGVPFSPLSDRRFHLFGGRLRTGSAAEYMISLGFSGACLFVAILLNRESGQFLPFFYDWAGYYGDGLIDGAEWKKNRFKLF